MYYRSLETCVSWRAILNLTPFGCSWWKSWKIYCWNWFIEGQKPFLKRWIFLKKWLFAELSRIFLFLCSSETAAESESHVSWCQLTHVSRLLLYTDFAASYSTSRQRLAKMQNINICFDFAPAGRNGPTHQHASPQNGPQSKTRINLIFKKYISSFIIELDCH